MSDKRVDFSEPGIVIHAGKKESAEYQEGYDAYMSELTQYREGYNSYSTSNGLQDNPYGDGGSKGNDWNRGWRAAEDEHIELATAHEVITHPTTLDVFLALEGRLQGTIAELKRENSALREIVKLLEESPVERGGPRELKY